MGSVVSTGNMKSRDFISNIYLIILPFVVLGIYVGFSVFPICIALIFIRLFSTNRQTAGFYLTLFGGTLGGLIRNAYPFLPVYGIIFEFLGIMLLFKDFWRGFKNQKAGFWYLISLLAFFLFTYIIGPHTEYANGKIIGIIQNGLTLFLAYYVFERSKKVEIECLTQLLIISSVTLIVFASYYYHYRIGGIFDYEWYRAHSEALMIETKEGILGGYQLVGMNAAYAAALFLSLKKIEIQKALYYVLIASQVVMTSGCRQALVAIIVVIFIRMVFFNDSGKTKRNRWMLIVACVFLYVVYVFIKDSDISTLSRTMDEGDTGRFMIYLSAIEMFLSHPVLGVGLGGFPEYANITLDTPWPHNLILEILCETGIVGLIVISVIVIRFVQKTHVNMHYVTGSGCYLFLFLSALFVRIMVSSDFTTSIELFAALFAYGYVRINTRNHDKLFSHNTL